MPLSKALRILKAFADEHLPVFPFEGVRPPSVAELDAEVDRQFAAARPVVDHVSVFVQFTHAFPGHEERMFGATIRSVRQLDQDTFVFRADMDPTGHPRNLSTDHIHEIYSGEFADRHLKDQYQVPSLETWLVEIYNAFHGRFSNGRYAIDRDSMTPLAPHIAEFVRPLQLFDQNLHADLRHQLHVLLYLARLDGRFCEHEREAVKGFINRCCEGNADLALGIYHYASLCVVTRAVFDEALDFVDRMPKDAIRSILNNVHAVVQADGHISAEEDKIYRQVMAELEN